MKSKKSGIALALALGLCLTSPVCLARNEQPANVASEAEVEAASRAEVFKRAAEISQQADAAWKKVTQANADKKVSKKERKRLKEEARRLTAEARPWNAKRDEYLRADNAELKARADAKIEALKAVSKQTPEIYDLNFNGEAYQQYTMQVDGQAIAFRAYENLVYVAQPADPEHQRMSIYIPEAYFNKGSKVKVNGFRRGTAPIFMPNGAADYAPAPIQAPAEGPEGANASLRALAHGYVVAAPALRGREEKVDAEGHYVATAIEPLVDCKAAVRYLRHNRSVLPAGDTEYIISSGSGVGATLSALLGTTGNHADYEPYLLALNAAPCRDDVAVAQCVGPLSELVNYAGTNHPVPDYRAASLYPKLLEPLSYTEDEHARKAYLFSLYHDLKGSNKEMDKLAAELEQAGARVDLDGPYGNGAGDAAYMEEFFANLDEVLPKLKEELAKKKLKAEAETATEQEKSSKKSQAAEQKAAAAQEQASSQATAAEWKQGAVQKATAAQEQATAQQATEAGAEAAAREMAGVR